MSLVLEKTLHHAVLVIAAGLVIFGMWYGYQAMYPAAVKPAVDAASNVEEKGTAKPLPDFIVDKFKPNELEQLKP